MVKREHSFVSCAYEEKQHRTMECVRGILPESALQRKREGWARQHREPWQETASVSVQNVRENVQR